MQVLKNLDPYLTYEGMYTVAQKSGTLCLAARNLKTHKRICTLKTIFVLNTKLYKVSHFTYVSIYFH